MNKTELANAVAQQTGLNQAAARKVIDALFGTDGIIADALRRGEQVTISGFGSFAVKERAARTGRNPRTGEAVEIGPSRTPRFRAGAPLKNALR